MKKYFFLFIFLLMEHGYSQQYSWQVISDKIPNTKSTVTISAIDIIGDSIWICSGYGNYLNQTPGEIYFSSDGGNSFSIQNTKYGTHTIKMLDAKKGYCGGVEGQIYRTSNGGEVWERWPVAFGSTIMSIDFPPNSDIGLCSGFNAHVKQITPSGLVSISLGNYVSHIYSVSCIDKDHSFVAGEEIIGPIINGVLQIDQSYPGTNGIYAIDMVDSVYGWCVGSPTAAGAWDSSGCMIIKTVDGHNWEEQINPVKSKTGTLMAIKAINKNEAWACGTSGVILHTTDGGENWIQEAKGLTSEMLYGIAVNRVSEVFITGNNRTVLKYGHINGIQQPYVLNNFISPNPAGDYIEILHLNPPHGGGIEGGGSEIHIYNYMGELILSDVLHLGDVGHLKRIDISHLPEGVYFVKFGDEYGKFVKG